MRPEEGKVNTKNILFICGGAFDGIEKNIARRLNTRALGYGRVQADTIDRNNLMQYVMPQDVRSFGLIPELVGRLPVIVGLDSLDEAALVRILSEPKNSLVKQYTKLMAMDNVQLEFEDSALSAIASLAIERNTGARGLRSIIEEIMTDIMFSIPSEPDVRKVVITKECVNGGEPKIIRRKAVSKKKAESLHPDAKDVIGGAASGE